MIEERKLIIQHPRVAAAFAIDTAVLLQIEKFLYPNRMAADIRIIPTSVVSNLVVNFPLEDRQTGETEANAKGNISDKSVSINTVISTVVRQGNKQKGREREKKKEREEKRNIGRGKSLL